MKKYIALALACIGIQALQACSVCHMHAQDYADRSYDQEYSYQAQMRHTHPQTTDIEDEAISGEELI